MSAEASPTRILVADDELSTREMLYRLLNRYGEIIEAASGRQALDILESEHFDLVLLDVMMPGMTGIEVLEMMRRLPETSGLPVLLLSEFLWGEDAVRGIDIDEADYISKPIDIDMLLARVEAHLHASG